MLVDSKNNNNLSKLPQFALDKLLRKQHDVFSETPSVTNVYELKIIIKDEPKFVRRTHQVPMHFQQRVDQEIQWMVENNVFGRSESNFINPLLIVNKK